MDKLDLSGLSLLNIDVFKKHICKCTRIEIFFDKWLNAKERDPKFSLFKPFQFNFCVYSVGRSFIFYVANWLRRVLTSNWEVLAGLYYGTFFLIRFAE